MYAKRSISSIFVVVCFTLSSSRTHGPPKCPKNHDCQNISTQALLHAKMDCQQIYLILLFNVHVQCSLINECPILIKRLQSQKFCILILLQKISLTDDFLHKFQ